MSTEHFSQFFQVILDILTHVHTWLQSITCGPLSLWQWLVAFWCIGLIYAAIRYFTGLSGPTEIVEASRKFDNSREEQ